MRRESSDAEVTRRIGLAIGAAVTDLFSLLDTMRAETRDAQSSLREREAVSRGTDAREAHLRRIDELDRAAADRARAAEAGLVGDVLRWVGVGLALVVGTLGAVFSGGATLVGAVALAVALVATTTLQGLAQAGVVDSEAASIASIVVSAVATVVSLGASVGTLVSASSSAAASAGSAAASASASAASSAASSATSAATSAASTAASTALDAGQTIQQIGQLAQGLVTIAQGGTDIGRATLEHDAERHDIEATAHGQRRDAENELRDAAIDALSDLMRSFARVAASMADVREEATAATRAALTRRA
jgi:hypothetical protein